jgi:ferredoxin-NADP reductase
MTELFEEPSTDAKWQNATVVAIGNRTPRIKSFFLVPHAPFHFRSGQHVDLRLIAENGYTAMRSYSIGSSPSNTNQIELTVERLSDGEVSPFLHDVVAVGDDVEMRGPLGGHFTWSPTDGGPLLLIGGGSGVVPLMSMIRHQQMRLRQFLYCFCSQHEPGMMFSIEMSCSRSTDRPGNSH